MKRDLLGVLVLVSSMVSLASAEQASSGVDRLYILDCGRGTAPNQGRFSPGYNDGKPFELSDNCYLIYHPQG
jgi:N-acyl homoserine lactone hydrolase